jgi:hypothetical protein
MVALTEAGLTVVLAVLLFIYLTRLRTHRLLQKRTLQVSLALFLAAMLSNLLISAIPTQDAADALVLSKKAQGTFDHLFGISIGAFVMATVLPSATRVSQLFWNAEKKRPRSLLPYTAVFVVGIVGIALVPVGVQTGAAGTLFVFPTAFIALIVVTTATFLLYAPAKILGHIRGLRRAGMAHRNALLMLLGIETYATAELAFEIVLPVLGYDLRAIGFTINLGAMFLIAYTIQKRTFLEELAVPDPEANRQTERKFHLDPGSTYLVLEDRAERSFEIFQDTVTHGTRGLCITRQIPKKVQRTYGLQKTPILWLSRNAEGGEVLRPTPAEGIFLAIEHFATSAPSSVILLDGLEYLVSHNDFRSILALVNDLTEIIAMANAVLLVPVNPEALEPREIALLRRETASLPELTEGELIGMAAVAS